MASASVTTSFGSFSSKSNEYAGLLYFVIHVHLLSISLSLSLAFSSDDYKFFMINSSSNQTLAAHQSLNPHHQQQLLTPPLHNNQPSPTHSRSYVSLHHPQHQNMMNNNIMLAEKPLMTSYNPTDCLEMSDVIAGGGVSTAGTAGNSSAATVAGQEHYIYVTYPPELKRRLLERYEEKDLLDFYR